MLVPHGAIESPLCGLVTRSSEVNGSKSLVGILFTCRDRAGECPGTERDSGYN